MHTINVVLLQLYEELLQLYELHEDHKVPRDIVIFSNFRQWSANVGSSLYYKYMTVTIMNKIYLLV